MKDSLTSNFNATNIFLKRDEGERERERERETFDIFMTLDDLMVYAIGPLQLGTVGLGTEKKSKKVLSIRVSDNQIRESFFLLISVFSQSTISL
jgi:hypothetical protein